MASAFGRTPLKSYFEKDNIKCIWSLRENGNRHFQFGIVAGRKLSIPFFHQASKSTVVNRERSATSLSAKWNLHGRWVFLFGVEFKAGKLITAFMSTSTAEASGEIAGLYVLRSLIDQKHFSKLSSMMPYFHYQPATIRVSENQSKFNIQIDHCKKSFILDASPLDPSGASSLNEAMNFLQHRNTFVLTSGDFLEFADLHFAGNEERITGPIDTLEFHPDLDQSELTFEFATWIECADFHLILGRRERPAFVPEFAEIEQ